MKEIKAYIQPFMLQIFYKDSSTFLTRTSRNYNIEEFPPNKLVDREGLRDYGFDRLTALSISKEGIPEFLIFLVTP
ncbi:MAG: hypothetical protein ACUZ8N_09070 [Candidatus Scalindua sp.]